jgi:hypothetical protein
MKLTKTLSTFSLVCCASISTADESYLKNSDDLDRHRVAFVTAAKKLIAKGRCSTEDFREAGGWIKSTSKGQSIYFTYCGGFTISNRLYLDVSSGRIFQ